MSLLHIYSSELKTYVYAKTCMWMFFFPFFFDAIFFNTFIGEYVDVYSNFIHNCQKLEVKKNDITR